MHKPIQRRCRLVLSATEERGEHDSRRTYFKGAMLTSIVIGVAVARMKLE